MPPLEEAIIENWKALKGFQYQRFLVYDIAEGSSNENIQDHKDIRILYWIENYQVRSSPIIYIET
jgi:hypothetical protein